MNGWTVGWVAWLGWFVVEEGLALKFGGRAATLSGHVWRWFAVAAPGRYPSWRTRGRRFALLAFLAWLAAHFLTGGAF